MAQTSAFPLLDLLESLDDIQPIVEVEYERHESHFQRFAKFHASNPHVYSLLVRLCRSIRQRGLAQYSIGGIFEVARYMHGQTHGDKYKLNHNFRAYYARLIMVRESDLTGFFNTRETPHDPEFHQREMRA